MTRIFLYIGFIVLFLASCSKYEKIRKSPDNNYKYRKALEYYNKKDYQRATVLFDDVSTYFRATTKADSLNYYQAMSNYHLDFYIAAAEYFQLCYQNNPYSPFAEEAEYMVAYCYYLDSPVPSLDQESTAKSIELFGVFVKKHPQSSYLEKSKAYIEELQDKLVEKSYKSAKLYYDMKMYKSSVVALKSSLDDYPNTKYREELMWMVLKSNFLYAENSIESKKKDRYQSALDEYYSYASEFPEGPHIGEAKKIFDISEKKVK